MQAATLVGDGDNNALTLSEVPTPTCGATDVLIAVAAAGVNRADLLQIKGLYPPPAGAPTWPGLEVSGEIVAVGDAVTRWRVGQQVCALLPGGGYAQFAAVHQGLVLPVPAGLPLVDAAGLVEAACTVWSALDAADAQPGQSLLVHGGAGGIGSLAVQYAAARGLTVLATAGSPERVQTCRTLGATHAFDYTDPRWPDAVVAAGGADIVLDVMGASYLERNLQVLRIGGTLAIIGLQGGTKAPLDLGALLSKRTRIVGLTLRSRPLEERVRIVSGVATDVWPLVPHEVRPVIAGTFPLAQAGTALDTLEAGGVIGKLVLVP